jgi:hypothetical protein
MQYWRTPCATVSHRNPSEPAMFDFKEIEAFVWIVRLHGHTLLLCGTVPAIGGIRPSPHFSLGDSTPASRRRC